MYLEEVLPLLHNRYPERVLELFGFLMACQIHGIAAVKAVCPDDANFESARWQLEAVGIDPEGIMLSGADACQQET